MTPLIGNILNWLAAGVFFPLMLLPLASLIDSSKSARGGAVWVMLALTLIAVCTIFAALAVDVAPLRVSPSLAAIAVSGMAAITILVSIMGAGDLASFIATPLAAIVNAVGRITAWLLLAMAFIQFTVVILRYVFGVNFIFMQESVTYLHGAVFLLAGGYALLTDDHVRVDIFYREASPHRKALIDFAGTYLLLFPFCLITLWTASAYVGNSWAVLEGSTEQSGIQGVFLLKSLIPIYAVLLAMAGFVLATRAVDTLREKGS